MGYSLDNSSTTTTVNGASVSAQVASTSGVHVLHVKSWGKQGASCVTDVPITVAAAAVPTPVTNVVVSSPINGATLSSPFALAAAGTKCLSQPITAMGYSLDGSFNTTILNGSSVSAQVIATAGPHTLHVKSWAPLASACDTDIAITVSAPPPPASAPIIPANAIAIKAIQNLTTWKAAFDAGTGSAASSSGVMNLVPTPALSGSARQFTTTYSNYGGERYSVHIAADQIASNFVLDTWLYLASPVNDIANIEIDLNQVLPNGQTVIFGFQCDGWSHTWDYTANTGSSAASYNDQWLHSNQTCNPQKWVPNAWHHLQISYSRDSAGTVLYKSVWLDSVKQDLNVTAGSAFALGWGPSLLVNFQVDGMTSLPGTATIYLDNFTIYRW